MRPANFAPRGNNRETNVLDCCVWPLCVKSLTIFKRPICGGPAMNFRISFARISLAHSSASRTKIQSPVACASAKLRAAAKSLVQAKCATCAPFSLAILTVSSVEPVSVTMISSAMARTLRRQRAKQRASFLAIMASDNFISAIHRERLHERLDAVVVQTFFDVGGVEALAFGNEQQAAGRVDAARENHAGTQFAEGNLPFAARHGEQAREPRNVFADKLVGIAVAIVTLVVGADDVADFVEVADEGGEFLAENRVLLDQRAFGFGERVRVFLPAADDLARNADKADVVQQRGAFEHALLVRRQLGNGADGAAKFRDAPRLVSERRIKRLHCVDAEFDGAE